MQFVSTQGMLFYLMLAIAGGFLTGLFSRFTYQMLVGTLGKLVASLLTVVFYIAPAWAVLSLFKEDDLDIFYILLIVSFLAGVKMYRQPLTHSEKDDFKFPFEDL
jgi:hypothetical protein